LIPEDTQWVLRFNTDPLRAVRQFLRYMKFKTSLKGRLDAEINSVISEWDKQERADMDEPEVIVIDGVARGNKLSSFEIKAPWRVRREKDDSPTKGT